MQRTDRAAIVAMGRELGPKMLGAVQDFYRAQQDERAQATPATLVDVPYGADQRQRLDLYRPWNEGRSPVLLFVHGGGFIRGEKASPDHPYNAHVGRWAATNGMVGVVMNYRLAPVHLWPAGGEDVAAAVDWLRAHVAEHGGDPDAIVVMGTSAGAVHVASALKINADLPIRAAVLLSGLYGFTPLDERDELYYGAPDLYEQRMPLKAVVDTPLPLFVACAEFDPPRFQTETVSLLAARLARHGTLPRAFVAGGHNHFSLACHLGTDDHRLANEILSFVREQTGDDHDD